MLRMKFKNALFISFALVIGQFATASITLPKIFTSNMVLQRDKPLIIWGWAEKNEPITISFHGQKVKSVTDAKGNWSVVLKAAPVGGPFNMTIEGKNKITLSNILLGDVYICSGQSNMEWILRNANNATAEISESSYPKIRLFTVPKATSYAPASDLPGGEWLECNPTTSGDFSAVAYFFARKLNKDLNIPIGLIHSSWGGTNVQAWLSWDVMGKKDGYKSTDFTKLQTDQENIKAKTEQFNQALKNEKGEAEKWFEPGKATGWKHIEMPKIWEQTEIGNADGIVWFQKEFNLPAGMEGKSITLHLGPIDDKDQTWVNGQSVGSTDKYNDERIYKVDASVLKPGKNTIIIKVTDTGGGGGLYGKPEDLFMEAGDQKISLSGDWTYKASAINTDFGIQNNGPNDFPSQLYNAMIAPIIRYALKGGIWYQGEANAGEAYKYRELFPAMINDWRAKWKSDFPFFWVQLANFMAANAQPVESDWAELREAQSMTLKLPKTGQAVIIDIGNPDDIHPRNKQDVGYRLALAAEKVAYGKNIVYSGPVYRSMKIEGNKIILTFSDIGSGLVTKDKSATVKSIAIAGADKKFVWANATIKGNTVIVSSSDVAKPVAVRYAWANNPIDANLYNKEGLPASPFRTDSWPGITMGKSDYK
jgi:sialate O-acetylesterase